MKSLKTCFLVVFLLGFLMGCISDNDDAGGNAVSNNTDTDTSRDTDTDTDSETETETETAMGNEPENTTPARFCLLYTSPSPRDLSTSRMPSSA